MIYQKPKILKGKEKLPPLTTNFAPPPVEKPEKEDKKTLQEEANQKKEIKLK